VLLKTPFIEFVHPDDTASTMEAVAQLSTGAPVAYFENRYRCKDGSYKWLAWTSVPVIDKGFLYAVARDVTDKKRAEEEAQQHHQDMAHVIRLSTAGEMASGMAHELNQPLTAIASYYVTAASLVRNSLEAIGGSNISGGQVVLKTQLLSNDTVLVTVSDNGPGVNPELVDIVFHPFQSDKMTGMGIGLSISSTIIEAHGGKLWVDKDYQNGALFGFELPVSK